MALNKLFPGKAVKSFEITLETNTIYLFGSPQVASDVELKGTVALCLAEPLSFVKITVRLKGRCNVTINTPTPLQPPLTNDNEFYMFEKTISDVPMAGLETLAAGKHEYPFRFLIPGDIPESVEGRGDIYLVYGLKAVLDRGSTWRSLEVRRHLRIVRTLTLSSPELSEPTSIMTSDGDVKVELSLQTPAFIFGTAIPTTLKILRLSKALELHRVDLTLIELIHRRVGRSTTLYEWPVQNVKVNMNEDVQFLDEVGQDSWFIRKEIPLPDTLNFCMQDVRVMGIRFSHYIRCLCSFMNSEGEVLKTEAKLSVFIFLSPIAPVGEDQRLLHPPPADPQALQALGNMIPLYREHGDDRPWADIDVKGYESPPNAASGMNSPLQTRDRCASTGDLQSHASPDVGSLTTTNLQTLQNRLSRITEQSSSREATPTGAENRAPGRFPIAPVGDDGSGAGPSPGESRLSADLPSYAAAVGNPREQIPSYATAVANTPSSPTRTSPGGGQRGGILPRTKSAILTPIRRLRRRSGSSQSGGRDNEATGDYQPLI